MDHGVPKVKTLGLLDGAGSITVDRYAEILSKGGFPGTYHRAHRLLARFHAQGLVERLESQKTVQYRLGGREAVVEPVERRQRIVRWKLTEKGLGRLKWLQNRGSGPPSRGRASRGRKIGET